MGKSKGYIMPELCTLENLELAYKHSRKGKTYVHNMLIHKEFDPVEMINTLQQSFLQGTYETSEYTTFKIYEPKERIIFRLPYNPDRVAHHAIMNIMEDFWSKKLLPTSFSCVKTKGVHGVVKYLKKILTNNVEGTQYCLKMDCRKYFPSINHEVLKFIITKHIRDKEFLKILYEIIDSPDKYLAQHDLPTGVELPIGNFLSQYFANLYIAAYSWSLHYRFKNVYVIIYMDDIVILASNKEVLHQILIYTKNYFNENLKISIKDNYQIFPVDKRGIDLVGYVFFHNHIKVRKSIKKKIFKLIRLYKCGEITKVAFLKSMQSYFGWLKYADSKHLLQKIYNLTGIWYSNFQGYERKISKMKDKNILVLHYQQYNKYYKIQAIYHNTPIEIKSTNKKLLSKLKNIKFPNKIIIQNLLYEHA